MAVAIKRVIKFSYAKMNSVQSEQTRIRAKNKYKNDHICEEFKKFNLHPINNTEGLTYNQYFKKYCKRRTGGKKKVDVVSEMEEKDFYLDKLYTGKGGGKTTCCVESMVISLNDRIDATEEAIKAYQEDPDNQQKMDAFVTYITKSDPRFRNCRFLNVDWRKGEIRIKQRKTNREIVIPLVNEAAAAVQDYILNARPASENAELFLRVNPPCYAIMDAAAIGDMFKRYERKAGIERQALDGKGFHGLRRRLAKKLLISGSPTTEIAQILGHNDVDSVRQYLSLDTANIKECALDFSGIPLSRKEFC